MLRHKTTVLSLSSFLALFAAVHVCAGAPLFFDDFESAPNSTPYSLADQVAGNQPSSDSDPANTIGMPDSAQPGQWFHYLKSTTPQINIQVSSFIDPTGVNGPTVSGGGSNYLRMGRPAGTSDSAIGAVFSPWDQPITTGHVTASFLAYFPSSNPGGSHGTIVLSQFADNNHGVGLSGSKMLIGARLDGSIRHLQNGNGGFVDLTPPSTSPNVWQQWSIDANLDARTYVVTIDGVSGAPQPFNFAGSAMVALEFAANEGNIYFIDNVQVVPEPSAFALIAPAGFGLLCLRRLRGHHTH